MLFISAHVSEQTVLLLNWLLRVLSAPSLFFHSRSQPARSAARISHQHPAATAGEARSGLDLAVGGTTHRTEIGRRKPKAAPSRLFPYLGRAMNMAGCHSTIC
jgi:hypothetical protein